MWERSFVQNTSVGNQVDLLKVAGEQYDVLYNRQLICGEVSRDAIESVDAIM